MGQIQLLDKKKRNDLCWMKLLEIEMSDHLTVYKQILLFYAKSSLYIYIKYTGFGFARLYGISNIVVYFMPNPLYTYILNIQDLVLLGFMAYQTL